VIELPTVVTPPPPSRAGHRHREHALLRVHVHTDAPDACWPSPRSQLTVRASPLEALTVAVKTTSVAPAIAVPSGVRES